MDVELLVVPSCPNESAAYNMAVAALADIGVNARVRTSVIASDAEAVTRGFAGSPTFLINGHDPFARHGAAVGLACRVYRTASGLAGVPPFEELRGELRLAADS